MDPLKPFLFLATAMENVITDQLRLAAASNWQYERDMHRHYAAALGLAARWLRDAIAEHQQREQQQCLTT
jgi:hypothetical protein